MSIAAIQIDLEVRAKVGGGRSRCCNIHLMSQGRLLWAALQKVQFTCEKVHHHKISVHVFVDVCDTTSTVYPRYYTKEIGYCSPCDH